ncbi:MAG: GIY-YIG nuclease family protein [Clostridia bacterium]|nr:GIY-YIG nuclease family protein [Clostridia bacterium]
MEYFVYILRCADGSLYTGITNDLLHRLRRHNAGTGAKYTRSRRPVALVFKESCPDKSAALRREAQIKKLSREEKLKIIEKEP